VTSFHYSTRLLNTFLICFKERDEIIEKVTECRKYLDPKYIDEIQEAKFLEYESSAEKLNNDAQLEKQKFSLVKKLLTEKFQNIYGKTVPSLVQQSIDGLLLLTKNNHYIRN
jgi:hypothetical protein